MISLYQYQLPFLDPLRTGAGDITSREGVLIHFQDGDLDVLAEASPLPGFSKESLESAITLMLNIKSELNTFLKNPFDLEELEQFIIGPPSVQFAISDLGKKVIQSRGELPVLHPLFQSEYRTVLVNDILGYHDPETTKHLIELSLESGFKTIKIKVPSPDLALANVLRDVYEQKGDVIFRLDANQSWDDQKMNSFNKNFNNLPIEYIEEPYVLHEDEEIEKVSAVCEYPIALDESIQDLNHLTKLLKQNPNLFVIIKPMMLGNIFKIAETLSTYRSSYNRVVITSSLESAVGLETISILAASMGDNSRAHGLNSGKLFRNNLIADDDKINGVLNLNHRSDFPITPDQLDWSKLTLL